MTQKKTRKRFGMDVESLEEDKLSSRITRVKHEGKALRDMSEVKKKADDIKDKVTYLEDELRTVEVDESREAVILRSEEPSSTKEGIEYYEVEVSKKGSTEIQRKHFKRKDSDVEEGDFVLSDRLLERLGKDLEQISSKD